MAKKDQGLKYQVLPGAPKKVFLPSTGEIELDKLTPQQAKKLIQKGCKYVVETLGTEAAAAE